MENIVLNAFKVHNKDRKMTSNDYSLDYNSQHVKHIDLVMLMLSLNMQLPAETLAISFLFWTSSVENNAKFLKVTCELFPQDTASGTFTSLPFSKTAETLHMAKIVYTYTFTHLNTFT